MIRNDSVGERCRLRWAHPLGGLGDELIDDGFEVTGPFEGGELAVGTRAVAHDTEGILDFLPTSKLVHYIVHEPGEHLGDELARGQLLLLPEVDELSVQSEAYCPPLVLLDIRLGVDAEGHVVAAELPQLRDDRL